MAFAVLLIAAEVDIGVGPSRTCAMHSMIVGVLCIA
jgi:hypothetical protein